MTAEDRLWGLWQAGRRLERYVEDFLELANQLSWPDTALGACFQLGLDSEMICCELPVYDFPLIEMINLILYLNGSNYEVEEIKEKFQSRRPRRVSPAHSTPGTPTYRTNSPDRLLRPNYPRILRSSIIVLSPETPAVPESSPPSAAHSSLQQSVAASLTVNQKRNKRRKRLFSALISAPELAPVSNSAQELAPVSAPAPELAPVSAPARNSELMDMALPSGFSTPILTSESPKPPLVLSCLSPSPESPSSPLVLSSPP